LSILRFLIEKGKLCLTKIGLRKKYGEKKKTNYNVAVKIYVSKIAWS